MHQHALLNELAGLSSENRSPDSIHVDEADSLSIITLMNQHDQSVATAVANVLPAIAQAVDCITDSLLNNGRLIYVGAGSSGRLGVLDASECPPTFGISADQVIGLIAGGPDAMFQAQEGAEDSPQLALQDLSNLQLNDRDVVVGIAASGRTPYTIGALEYAKQIGAVAIAVCCNAHSPMSDIADIAITAVVGAEVLTGSTRLKSGTAQKMILNMLTTASMIRLGKCYENLMVDLKASNDKLKARATRILMQSSQCSQDQAIKLLQATNGALKPAILMAISHIDRDAASAYLEQSKGHLRRAIQLSQVQTQISE
ncbi:N-acetylmuramic acid 6-phosphate etherase [Celerinatantimonas yamalensis]|uniref:N-acetylmuramic acid 6-phosphate etherase n=1 Tax=Celerinatantimonas yamalensis TaxID=559956 RepID=A0ABW9G889_9GAMM